LDFRIAAISAAVFIVRFLKSALITLLFFSCQAEFLNWSVPTRGELSPIKKVSLMMHKLTQLVKIDRISIAYQLPMGKANRLYL